MGMSRVLDYNEQENKKEKKEMNVINYLTDYLFGFLLLPLLYVLFFVSVTLVKDPLILGDGLIILYISILTATYYILSRKTILEIDLKFLNIILFILGVVSFLLLFCFL